MKKKSLVAAEDCNFEKFHMGRKILRRTNVEVLVLLSSQRSYCFSSLLERVTVQVNG